MVLLQSYSHVKELRQNYNVRQEVGLALSVKVNKKNLTLQKGNLCH